MSSVHEDIVISGLGKCYAELCVLANFSCTLKGGAITCLMAPSGQGKTTLLRIIMGLETADKGSVLLPEGTRIASVFQEDRLCENMDSISNVMLVTPALDRVEAKNSLVAMGLDEEAILKPVSRLSGGMRRRVALTRALMSDCDLLLMDEPFKGLDEMTKMSVITETRRLINGRTTLIVSHDKNEAQLLEVTTIIDLSWGV